jgi:small-conductance mechanosensitive channel
LCYITGNGHIWISVILMCRKGTSIHFVPFNVSNSKRNWSKFGVGVKLIVILRHIIAYFSINIRWHIFMYLVCMHVCCFCYMYSRFEKLCRACVLCMLWYVSTLNKTLFIYLFTCTYSAIARIVHLLRTQPFKSFTGLYNFGHKYNSL